ncbi:MAG: SRPBCC family protein [Acidimicrobiia bacterium]|nr:SRPBCC family protein [Acidimicrobiia bacterium]
MREITVSRDLAAPRAAVWGVLADFPNIADWNGGVKKSFATSEATEGVGATRHCDLAPLGGLEETIKEWEPEERLVVSIDSAAKLPIKSGLATFTLDESDAATSARVEYSYETRFGPVGAALGPLLDKQLSKGFSGFLDDLETAANARAPEGDAG